MITYRQDDLWDELAYLAYHLHWDLDQLLDLVFFHPVIWIEVLDGATGVDGFESVHVVGSIRGFDEATNMERIRARFKPSLVGLELSVRTGP